MRRSDARSRPRSWGRPVGLAAWWMDGRAGADVRSGASERPAVKQSRSRSRSTRSACRYGVDVAQSHGIGAAQRHANRTIQCPVFLAEELSRCTFQPHLVKSFVKLYQQRMSVKPQLQMPPRMEDCVIRIMTQTKTCAEAMKSLNHVVVVWFVGAC